jgi:DNA repair exonuclease SbcCD nuclease subunit
MSKNLVFCADLQARESVYKHNPDLKDDDLVALLQVVKYCNDSSNNVSILVLGGDQVDSPTISDTHVIKLRKILRGCKIPVYYIDGNHEKGFNRFELEGGAACVATNLEHTPIMNDDLPVGVVSRDIAGYNWRPRREWKLIKDEIPSCDILILHGFADQAAPLIQGGSVSEDDELGDFDLRWFDGKCKLCLMGDIHMYSEYDGDRGTKFIYPGSMWMHRVNEPVDKFFLSVNLDTLETQKVPLYTRPFYRGEIKESSDILSLAAELKRENFTSVPDSRIRTPRVHLDIVTDKDLSKDIEPLLQDNFVITRVRPSETAKLVTGDTKTLDIESGIVAFLSDEDAEVKEFLLEVFRDSADSALAGLRDKLGVV